MTKDLPENADIDWLRKAAKARLKTWRAEGRAAKLADVQFEMARAYGFASWRALKVHLEKLGIPTELTDIAQFLRGVGSGWTEAVARALKQHPEWANATGPHPFWGGTPHPLHVAIDSNRIEEAALLLQAGADPDGRNEGYENWPPLMLALSWGREEIVTMLRAAGATETLGSALLSGQDDAVARFLASGALQEGHQPKGSPVALARTPAAVDMMLAAGADPLLKDAWGQGALETFSRLGKKGAPLVAALARHGMTPAPRELARMGDFAALERCAADNPGVLKEDAVLMAAVDFGHIELAKVLVAQGANVNARHDFGSEGTALHSAAWNGDVQMVKALLALGADTSLIDAEHGTTPLVWAQTARTVTNNPDCDNVAALLTQQ